MVQRRFLGSETLVECETGLGRLRAPVPRAAGDPGREAEVRLGWDPAHTVLLED